MASAREDTLPNAILFIAGWGLFYLAGLGAWAESQAVVHASLSSAAPHLMALVVLAALPPSLIIPHRGGWALRSRICSLSSRIRSSAAVGVVMFIFALGQLHYLIWQADPRNTRSYIMLGIGAFMGLQILAQEDTKHPRRIALASMWCLSIVLVRTTMSDFVSAGDFPSASWRYQLTLIALGTLMTFLILGPLVQIRSRWLARAQSLVSWGSRIISWAAVPLLIFAFLLAIANQFTDFESLQLVTLERLAVVVAVWAIACAALGTSAIASDSCSDGQHKLSDIIYRLALLGVVTILVAFSLRLDISGINPDGLAYFSIAKHYADGSLVVRGYWSPLLSWILAVPMAIGVPPLDAYKALTLLAGGVWLAATLQIARRWGLTRMSRVALAALVALLLMRYGFSPITPDVLGAAAVSVCFLMLTGQLAGRTAVRSGVAAGAVIALSYYAKYYNLAFLIAFVPIVFLIRARDSRSGRSVLKYRASLAIGAVLFVLPWLIGIRLRYGEFALTTSATINRALVAPKPNGHGCWQLRLCNIPSDVLFPWEDPPAQYYPSAGWSPFEGVGAFEHQISLLWSNFAGWARPAIIGPHALPPIILGSLVVLPFLAATNSDDPRRYLLLSLAVFVFMAGYQLTYGRDLRYYFPIIPMAWIGFYEVLDKLTGTLEGALKPPRARSIFQVVILALPLLFFSWYADIRFRLRPQESVLCYADSAVSLRPYLVAPMAGTDVGINYIAYFTGVQTLGVVPSDYSIENVDALLRSYGVRTLLAPLGSTWAHELSSLHEYTSVGEVEVCGSQIAVFRVPDS